MHKSLLAGAGKAEIIFNESCFPTSGFTKIHDLLHIRALILKGDLEILILSVEITSLFPDVENRLREIASEESGINIENVWITLTHSFGGPHMWPEGGHGPGPAMFLRTEEDRQKNTALKQAHFEAAKKAVQRAVDSLQPAAIGRGKGQCTINASRNVRTDQGWWIGTNCEEPCDHSVSVLSIRTPDGKQLAFLFEYGIRSCVITGVAAPDGGNYVSSDLAGAACTHLEKEFGNDATAIFLCGACGDQEPVLKGCYDEQDAAGKLHNVSLGAGSFTLLEAQGRCLASEVLQINRDIKVLNDAPSMQIGKKDFICQTMPRSGRPEPTKHKEFISDGERTLSVHALCIDDFNLIGVQPEINGTTSVQITEALRENCTAVATMVNGGDKCMPEKEAYDLCKYQSLNSNVMPGSAELLRDTAIELIRDLRA